MSKSAWIHIIFDNACSTLGLWLEKIGGSEIFLILICYLGPLVHSDLCVDRRVNSHYQRKSQELASDRAVVEDARKALVKERLELELLRRQMERCCIEHRTCNKPSGRFHNHGEGLY